MKTLADMVKGTHPEVRLFRSMSCVELVFIDCPHASVFS
jgi:hypothetical protein